MAKSTKYCTNCGEKIDIQAEICPKCGVRQPFVGKADKKSKIAAGLFAIFLGPLGIHKFYLGKTGQGIAYLLISLLTLGVGAIILAIISLIEGIVYLSTSDEDFAAKYK